jgi:hypothetical protein
MDQDRRELDRLTAELEVVKADRDRVAQRVYRDSEDLRNALQERDRLRATIERVRAALDPVADSELPIGYDNSELATRDFARDLRAILNGHSE